MSSRRDLLFPAHSQPPYARPQGDRTHEQIVIRHPEALLAVLLPLGLLTLRRPRSLPTLLALTLLAIFPIAGCSGTPRQLPGSAATGATAASATPTPPGTYTLTVTATSAGLSRSIKLLVTVQ